MLLRGPQWRRSRHGFAVFFLGSLLLAFLGLRLVLFFKFKPEASISLADGLGTFLIGFHRDFLVALIISLLPLFWFWVLPERWFPARWPRRLFWAVLFLFWVGQCFLLVVEYYFFEEFRSRFNTVAVDYLLYPHEVFINIWDTYPVATVLVACALLSAAWLAVAARLFGRMWEPVAPAKWRLLPLAGVGAVCALLSPTVSLKGIHFSNERLLNELADNGLLSFLSAAWTGHLEYRAFYQAMPGAEAYQRVRRLLAEPGAAFEGEGADLRRRMAGDPSRPRLNVVIVLEESLGSEFWGCLGRQGASLTPEMDRLAAEEGLLFTRIYASGNRTVRGFEGVLASFPPLPGDAIVKGHLSQNVETIARVLKRDGYRSVFLYGGRGVFDGMRSFAVHNGYDRFIEQKHFKHPTFSTIWGVCDEDLFQRTIQECRALSQSGQPFLATLLTVSNHKPFTYPAGRIAEDPNKRRRSHAVKYADYALGQFFRAAKQEPFWTNTVFVVVADHGARVYGSQSIPIDSYEIPVLIAGPAVVKQPARLPHLGCSLDVAPTVLGLVGRPYESLFFGRDLLKGAPDQGRVLLNHNRDIGLFARERLVVLGLKQAVELYAGDPKVAELKPVAVPGPLERELQQDAVAIYQVADELYTGRRYRID